MKKITVFLICISLFIPQFLSNESFSIKGEDTYFNNVIYTKINNESKKEIFRNVSYDETSWPSFRHDSHNSGFNPNAFNNNSGRLIWKYVMDGYVSHFSPIISHNNIIIGTAKTGPSNCYFYIFDKEGNGVFKNSSFGLIQNSPAIDLNGNIIFSTHEKNIISIKENGSINWIKYIDDLPISSINIFNNKIYFGSKNYIFCFYTNGTINWKYYIGDTINTAPSIDNSENVYFGSINDYFYSLYPNGSLRWKYKTSDSISNSSPLIGDDGNIYIGSTDSYLYSFYPNGSLNWKYQTNGEVRSSPSFYNNSIYFGSNDGFFYALNKSGSLLWKFFCGSDIQSSPCIDGNGVIYFGSFSGSFYALYSNGSLKWKFNTPKQIISSPSIDNNGTIYFVSWNILYSIGNTPPSNLYFNGLISGNEFINLSWDLPIDDGGAEIQNFNVYRNTSGSSPEFYSSVSASNLFFNDTNVINGVEYSYWISAENREGESELAGPFNATPRGPPSSPLNVSIISGPAYLNISWEGPFTDGGYSIEGFRIYRKEAGIFLLHAETMDHFYIDDVANPGVNYSYYITAFNDYGEGVPTSIFFGMSIGVPPPPDPVSFERFNEAIRIDWSMGLTGLEEYEITEIRIYRDEEVVTEVSTYDYFFNDTGLINGVDYTYQLSCTNIAGEGALSSEFIISPAWIPTPPLNLTARKTSSDVTLSWDHPVDDRGSPVISYRVYRRQIDENWSKVTDLKDMSWTDTDVEIGKTYEYTVDCYNEIGSSDMSGKVIITIQEQDPPDPPVLKKVEKTDENSVRLLWEYGTDSEGITFHIYRSLDQDTGFIDVGTSNQNEYLDSDNIIWNSTYYYYITAVDEYGESGPSEIKSIFIEGPGVDDNHGEEDEPFPTSLMIVIVVVVILILVGSIFLFFMMKKKRESSIDEEPSIENEIFGDPIPEVPCHDPSEFGE